MNPWIPDDCYVNMQTERAPNQEEEEKCPLPFRPYDVSSFLLRSFLLVNCRHLALFMPRAVAFPRSREF